MAWSPAVFARFYRKHCSTAGPDKKRAAKEARRIARRREAALEHLEVVWDYDNGCGSAGSA
jgi:hypothetical protein